MRYALISDIHANLPALEAVLADIGARSDVAATYHLGDLVGYAPWPNETVSLLREAAIAGIAGNYDSTVATDYRHCGCKYEDARQEELSHLSFEWTKAHTSPEVKQYLASVLAKLGCRREARAALAAARDGLKESDPWRGNLDQTARDIEASPRRRGKACDTLD